jgi:hypothetical protein
MVQWDFDSLQLSHAFELTSRRTSFKASDTSAMDSRSSSFVDREYQYANIAMSVQRLCARSYVPEATPALNDACCLVC